MAILTDILYWLGLWFLVGLPVSLMLAPLLKVASEQLQRVEAERRLEIRRPRPSYLAEAPTRHRRRSRPLSASPAAGR